MSQDPKDLLRACAESLLNAVNHLENRTPQQATTQATSQRNQSSNVPRQSSVEEHRNLLGYRPPTATRSSNRQPPSKHMVVTT